MAARPKEINFNSHFQWLWTYAQKQGFDKAGWLSKAGLSAQRFADFQNACNDKGGKNVSEYYFLKLVAALDLTTEEVEELSGNKFTEEQREELQLQALIQAHKWAVKEVLTDPHKLKIFLDLAKMGKK